MHNHRGSPQARNMNTTAETALTIDNEINIALEQIQDREQELCLEFVKPFRLNTMTVSLQMECFHFQNFENYHTNYTDSIWDTNCSPKFYNCIFLKKRGEKVSVKVFRNGTIHLTGIQRLVNAIDYGNQLGQLLQPFSSSQQRVKSLDVQLMNGAFKLSLPDNKSICLQTAYAILSSSTSTIKHHNEDIKFDCSFNNDHHSALKLKFKMIEVKVTASLFGSGSVLIQSFRAPVQLLLVHSFLMSFFQTNLSSILRPDVKCSRKRARHFDYAAYM